MNIDINGCASSLVDMLHAIGTEFKRPVNRISKRHGPRWFDHECLILKSLKKYLRCYRQHIVPTK